MIPDPPPLDHRANLVAGAVVATVVLLLGFGSGIGAVVTRHSASSVAPAASTATVPTVQSAAAAPAALVAARPAAAEPPLPTAAAKAARAPAVPSRASAVTPARNPGAAGGAGPRAAGATAECSGQLVVDAMAEPFVVHLNKAHLEASPGQQVADLLDLDQYVKTHTVLAGRMAAPALDAGMASLGGLDPFIVHVNKAHLEESPGQQAADVLDLDQYVKTHTVLLGSMVAPAADAATSAGC